MKLTHGGTGFGRFVLRPITVVAVLALLTTAVAFAATPATINAPAYEPSAIVVPDEEAPAPDDTDGPKASRSPGACNALNGNAPQVIAELVANWPTKHDKGDATKDVPAGLQKVADRLLACQWPAADSSASPSPNGTDDKHTKTNSGKKSGQGKDH